LRLTMIPPAAGGASGAPIERAPRLVPTSVSPLDDPKIAFLLRILPPSRPRLSGSDLAGPLLVFMTGLEPVIDVLSPPGAASRKAWITGSSPVMTSESGGSATDA